MIDLKQISRNLEQSPQGDWLCKSMCAVSYPEWGNQACFDVEDSSFWFRHRNACILEVMRQYPPPGPLFDIGGGNGFIAKAMQDAGLEVVLVEPGGAGTTNARKRGIQHVVRATLEDAGFLSGTLPAVGLFDVVEHMADDQLALANIASTLREGGRAIVLVPQGQSIYGTLDVVLGHHRRYSEQDLSNVMEQAGLRVEKMIRFNRVTRPAWYMNGKILRRRAFGRLQLWIFDRTVWLWRRIDRWLPWNPVSIIAVGVKHYTEDAALINAQDSLGIRHSAGSDQALPGDSPPARRTSQI